jgi:hypothetical protein
MSERLNECLVTAGEVKIPRCSVCFDSSGNLEIFAPTDLPEDASGKLRALPTNPQHAFPVTIKKTNLFDLSFQKCISHGFEIENQAERLQIFVGGADRNLIRLKLSFLIR